ncbi:MAG: hypothetical protein ACN0LA_05850 [Candidatus Longimicrobiales bacterium M2_2A_002]
MRALATVLLLAVAVPAVAQEREIRDANLPRDLEWELLRMYDGGARRMDGPATIAASDVIRGDVAVMGGPLRVSGRIEGSLAMVGGDVIIEPGGTVTGDVTVVGGEVRMSDDAEVVGTITAYATSSRGHDDRSDRRGDDDGEDRWRYRESGFSRLTVRAGAGYNRVEGLPLMFGPVLQTAGANPLRLEALAIWRTEPGVLDTDRTGYQIEAEQYLGGDRVFSVGGSVYSVVEPMDRWQLGELEASLATVLFHDDYRDYYEREGWSAFATVAPTREVEVRVGYRQEDHAVVAPGDPWTLFDGDEVWRAQPVIAAGEIRLVEASLELDYRDDEDYPWRGWLARVSVQRPVDGTLTRPALSFVGPDGQPGADALPARELDTDFTTALVDVRRYMPISYESQLNLRLVAGGSLSERALPAQFQHALGGIGTLPGFSTFFADCGARVATGQYADTRFYTGYGCDRFILGQVEYRGELSVDFGFDDPDHDEDDDWWDEVHVGFSPEWVVFFDAGQGWAYGDAQGAPSGDTGMLYDAGVGFLLDQLGFYVALPLNSDVDQDPRFFVRFERRF